jgi:hypothetical protein
MLINQLWGKLLLVYYVFPLHSTLPGATEMQQMSPVRVFVSITKETAALGMHLLYYWTGAPVSYIVRGD